MFEMIGGILFWREQMAPWGHVIGHLHKAYLGFDRENWAVEVIIGYDCYRVMSNRTRLDTFDNFITAYKFALSLLTDVTNRTNYDSRIYCQF